MAQSAKQKAAFTKMLASKTPAKKATPNEGKAVKGDPLSNFDKMQTKKGKMMDPTKPFPAPNEKKVADKKKSAKIDAMLMKAMTGVSMPKKKVKKK